MSFQTSPLPCQSLFHPTWFPIDKFLQFSTLLQFRVLLQFVFYKKKINIEFCVVLFSACKEIFLDEISVSISCINLFFKRCCYNNALWNPRSVTFWWDLVLYFCKFGLMSALVFLLHKKHFESITFFFWTLWLPLTLIIYSVFWLCFGLQGNRINWKRTSLRWKSNNNFLKRNIDMEHDDCDIGTVWGEREIFGMWNKFC